MALESFCDWVLPCLQYSCISGSDCARCVSSCLLDSLLRLKKNHPARIPATIGIGIPKPRPILAPVLKPLPLSEVIVIGVVVCVVEVVVLVMGEDVGVDEVELGTSPVILK